MEVYYRKYAQSPKYRLMRAVDDIKFRRKKEKARRSQPRPTYTPPNRTPEEALAHQREMRAMYKKYHVSLAEKLRRKLNDWQIRFREWKQDSDATAFLRQVSGWCIAVILVVSIAFSAYVTACMMRGKPAVFFGRSVLRIETGSMEPTLHVGDCIIVRTDSKADPEPGQIVAYYSEQSDISGMLITHRVDSVSADGTYMMRGDANPVSDSLPVRRDQIFGIYEKKSGFFAWVSSFANTRKVLLLAVMLLFSVIALYELRSLMKLGKEAKDKKHDADYERRMRAAIDAEKARLAEADRQKEAAAAEPDTEDEVNQA